MRWGLSRAIIFLTLLALAIGSFVWLDRPSSDTADDPLTMSNLKADYYLEDFVTISYDMNGAPEYQLSGDTLTHYPARKASEISAPKVVLQREAQPEWRMTSESGWLEESDQSISLEGNVILERDSYDEHSAIVIKTAELSVKPKAQALETEADIEIRSDEWVLRSTGMKSNLSNGTLSLLSNVRAQFNNP